MILEPIFRFTDTSAVPMKSIHFTKLPQYWSVTQNTPKLNISQFNAVRGPTQEMFLKDLGCGLDTCQNLPIKVNPVYSVIDSKGRLKFETTPSGSEIVLGKAGYLAKEEEEGLIRYDEYYSEDSDMFAYTNGKYPNQFGACQLRDYGSLRYKFVRTLGYAFTAVSIPDNLPIYSIFGYDDGLSEQTTTTVSLSPSQFVFTTNPIWTILKNSTNGTQGVGSARLPWSPPVVASPIEPTNVCLLNGNISILSNCGDVDRVLQFYDKSHVYIGFIDSVYISVDTYIYSYIGYAFKSQENSCGIPLEPIREMYKPGVGFTVVAGNSYSDLISQGFTPTGNIVGYTIDCKNAPNGQFIVTIPDGLSTISLSSTATLTPPVGYYVEPVKIVSPPATGGKQGYWLDPDGLPSNLHILETSNVCLFTANDTVIRRCGYARNLYLYYDIEDDFYFISLYTFGRNVTSKLIGIAFENEENSCGLDLVPIRELYKTGIGYQVVAGDDYDSFLDQDYNITGNIVGYTVDCKDSKDDFVYGNLPAYKFSTLPTTSTSGSTSSGETSESTSSEKPSITSSISDSSVSSTSSRNRGVGFYVQSIFVINNTEPDGEQGYWSGGRTPSSILNETNVCIFVANTTVYEKCGFAKKLYLYYDKSDDFYFVGIQSFGRDVNETEVGHAFQTDENVCGLDLVPIREYYKEGVGYFVIAGDDDSSVRSAGYTATGNIMGYAVNCKDAIYDFVYGNIPDYDFTTLSNIEGSSIPTVAPNSTEITSLYIRPLENVTIGNGDGQLGTALEPTSDMEFYNRIPVCIFPSNDTFLPFCGDAKPLYQYYDTNQKFYFIGIDSFGRSVTSIRIGTAFASAENICGLKLRPMRELYKQEAGYTVVAGDNYSKLVSEGYTLTGNILGYTVRCKEPKEKMICANLPSNWTTTTKTTTQTTTPSTTKTTLTTTPTTTVTTQKPTTTPYDLKAPLPKLDCNTIENYGDLRWRMVQFSRYMEVGDNFTITGHIWRNATESSLNMYVGLTPKWLQSKISMHINMRWWRSDIIYNYFWGQWDYSLETTSRRPFSKGLPYVLSIIKGRNFYLVYGNGDLIKKYWMPGDYNLHKVGGFMGFREWTIDTARMDCASTTSSSTNSTVTPTTSSTTTTTPTSTTTTVTTTSTKPTTTVSSSSSSSSSTTSSTTVTTSSSTSRLPTTTPYNLSAPLPKLECNTIEFYGDLRWRPINFGRTMEVGDNITLTGHIWSNASQSNVNFYLGFNPKFGTSFIPVHITQRWASTRIIYNNYWNAWGAEAYSSRPFSRGSPFVLSIVKTGNSHAIYGNGQPLINFYYRGTAAQNAVGSMIAYNEWTIDTVRMDCARPPTTSTSTVTSTTTPSTSTSTTTSPTSTARYCLDTSNINFGKGDSNNPQIELAVEAPADCANPPTTSTVSTTATTPTTSKSTTTTTTSTTSTSTVTSTTTPTPSTSTTTRTTPTTSKTTTTLPETGNCVPEMVTLGKGDSNNPQFQIDTLYGPTTGTGSQQTLTVYCQGISSYTLNMIFNENQGGPQPTTNGYMEIQLQCSTVDGNSFWTYSGVKITSVSCFQVSG